MLVSIIAVVLAAAAFALVGYPLLRERREEAPEVAMPDEYELALEDLTAQRDSTYSAIKELDFDQEMGNLPEADYRELRDRYRQKAATILRDLDELQEAGPSATRRQARQDDYREEIYTEDDIEREISRRRRGRSQAAGPRQGIAAPRQGIGDSPRGMPGGGQRAGRSRRACRSCGARVGPQDNFCPECGTPFSSGCPHCGAPHRPEDHFCARCGGALEEVAVR